MKSKKTCEKNVVFDMIFLEGSFFLTGGVLFILKNIWSPEASERGSQGG